MKSTSLFLSIFLAFMVWSACQNQSAPAALTSGVPAVKTFRGIYIWNDSNKIFTNCADGYSYHLKDETMALDTLYQKALQFGGYPNEAVYAVVQGIIQGNRGESGTPTLVVMKTDTVERKNMFNCCIPYDFWCTGTEPFWDLEISEHENRLFFNNVGAASDAQFIWSNPETDGSSIWKYRGAPIHPGQSGITILIKKEPCSDGMSDRHFSYSAKVMMGKDTFRGCAVRWGEKMPTNK